MLEEGEEAFEITAKGRQWLSAFGIDLEEVERSRRARASRCLDWSERTPHLGGALGAAILDQLQSRKWVTRKKGSRAVTLTPLGRREPKRALGIALSPS